MNAFSPKFVDLFINFFDNSTFVLTTVNISHLYIYIEWENYPFWLLLMDMDIVFIKKHDMFTYIGSLCAFQVIKIST